MIRQIALSSLESVLPRMSNDTQGAVQFCRLIGIDVMLLCLR